MSHIPFPLTSSSKTPRNHRTARMPRSVDSGQIDLAQVFRRIQTRMLADLSIAGLLEHASTNGAATEHHWLTLFSNYLPTRYRATSAFIINASGRRSRQIDI